MTGRRSSSRGGGQDGVQLAQAVHGDDHPPAELLGEEGGLDERLVLVAVAEDQGLGVVLQGERHQQLGLGAGLDAQVEGPAVLDQLLDHVALLVDLDRVDAAVGALVVVLRDRLLEGAAELLDPRPQDVGEADEEGQVEPAAAQVVHQLLEVDGADPGPAGVTSTLPASLMVKKSRPQPLTLYSSIESLIVHARSSVCNLPRHLLRPCRAQPLSVSSLRKSRENCGFGGAEGGFGRGPAGFEEGAFGRTVHGRDAPPHARPRAQLRVYHLLEGLEGLGAGEHAAVDEVAGGAGDAETRARLERRLDGRVVPVRRQAGLERAAGSSWSPSARPARSAASAGRTRHEAPVVLPELPLLARAAGGPSRGDRLGMAVEREVQVDEADLARVRARTWSIAFWARWQ